jgi:hypothetical protein
MIISAVASGTVTVLATVALWSATVALVVRLLIRWFRGPARSRLRAWWTLGAIGAALVLSLALVAPSRGTGSSDVTRQTHQIPKP